jgi:hypothetical protein
MPKPDVSHSMMNRRVKSRRANTAADVRLLLRDKNVVSAAGDH